MTYRNPVPYARRTNFYVRPGTHVAVWDVETSGLKAGEDRIIQFSSIKYTVEDELEEIDRRDFYVNPERPLEKKITELTGITDDMLSEAPPMSARILEIKDFLEDADVWVGHNIDTFDVKMLDGECERINVWIRHSPTIDTLTMARDFLRKGEDVDDYKLGTIVTHLFPEIRLSFHDSLDDVKATARLFQWGCEKSREVVVPDKESSLSVNSAYYFVNPRRQSQKRICLRLSDGEAGDIFYDVIAKQWSCKTTAKKFFKAILDNGEMASIETKVLEKYGFSSMDEMAKKWKK